VSLHHGSARPTDTVTLVNMNAVVCRTSEYSAVVFDLATREPEELSAAEIPETVDAETIFASREDKTP